MPYAYYPFVLGLETEAVAILLCTTSTLLRLLRFALVMAAVAQPARHSATLIELGGFHFPQRLPLWRRGEDLHPIARKLKNDDGLFIAEIAAITYDTVAES